MIAASFSHNAIFSLIPPSFPPCHPPPPAAIQDSTRNADLPYDFFMSRYKDAYLQETKVRGREGRRDR